MPIGSRAIFLVVSPAARRDKPRDQNKMFELYRCGMVLFSRAWDVLILKEVSMRVLKRICLLLVLTVLVFRLTGCNTVQGLGEDIEVGGKALQEAAD